MRSRTGCLTCRQRKLKCDETKPVCGQCQKANRHCQPSSGIAFRHQHNASMNSTDDRDAGLNGFYAYKNTFDDRTTWVDIPNRLTFRNIIDPYSDDLASLDGSESLTGQDESWTSGGPSRSPSDFNAHGLEALSAAALYNSPQAQQATLQERRLSVRSTDEPTPPKKAKHLNSSTSKDQSPPTQLISPAPTASSGGNKLNMLLNPSSSQDSPIDPNLTSPSHHPSSTTSQTAATAPASPPKPPDEAQVTGAETDHKMAFLLRHFSEAPGQWMDLFDLGLYFAQHVPIQAMTHPLLKHAACSYSAKQLGRVKGRKAVFGGIARQQASMENYSDPAIDWEWEGAAHYETSIRLLMEVIQEDEPAARSDEVVAATAILSIYEFISATGAAWSRHLNGTKSLLDIVENSMMPLEVSGCTYPALSTRRQISTARKATFWNFARQDYLAAFINETQTRLDTEDLEIWKAAGLQLTNDGFIVPSNDLRAGMFEGDPMGVDMISNALIWVSSRICNYIATGDNFHATCNPDRTQALRKEVSSVGETQRSLLERWNALNEALDIWFKGLPSAFRPSARIKPTGRADLEGCPFNEVWYTIPMCGSTMQHYHMARILLLINKPHETTAGRSSIGDRIGSYRHIDREAIRHCYEIIGIALSRPPDGCRVHQTQPLFVAGQYFEQERERKIVLALLTSIRDDLGWSTEDRIRQLLVQWGWNMV